MTEVLKTEMSRVARARRSGTVNRLAEYVRLQAMQARARQEAWSRVLPSLTTSPAALDAAKEAVAAVARKAEAKARAASTAKKGVSPAAGAAVGGAGQSAIEGGAAPQLGQTGLFADSAPIPNANEL